MSKERKNYRPLAVFITLGCKANQYDTAALMALLPEDRFEVRELPGKGEEDEPAEVYVINTCAVTGQSSFQSRQMVRRARRWNPAAQVIVTGCLAAVDREALLAAGADLVAGPAELDRVAEFFQGRPTTPASFFYHPEGGRQNRGRAVVKIQDGCNSQCAYCIVPQTRGRARSLERAAVILELRALAGQGFAEVVLTGIHLGRYGVEQGFSLAGLIREIETAADMPRRLRLSSLEPQEISDELLAVIAESPRICPHLHLPLQSGDREILRRMRRPYTPEEIETLFEKLIRRLPAAGLGVDLIAGFPGETTTRHRNTVALIESLPATYFHVFPFSRRPNTLADRMPDQVPPEIIKARAQELRELGARKKKDFLSRQEGRTLTVLAESRKEGAITGTSENYVKVKFPGPASLIGELCKVRVDQAAATQVSGTPE